MSTASIYTKRVLGLDKNVWLTLVMAVILSLGLLGYSLIGKEVCMPANLSVKSFENRPDGIYFRNEMLRFNAAGKNAKNIVWDFGDNTNPGEGFNVTHTFAKDGKYVVSVKVNGNCVTDTTIMVRIPPTKIEPAFGFRQIIIAPEYAIVDKAVTFICDSMVNTYEWKVLNRSNFPIRREKGAIYSFPTPGEFTVVLKLNNSDKEYKKVIYVAEDPNKPRVVNPGQVSPFVPRKLVEPGQNPVNTNNNPQQPATPTNPVYKPPVEEQPKRQPDPPNIITAPPVTEGRPKRTEISDKNFQGFLQDMVNKEMSEAEFYEYLCDDGKALVKVNDEKGLVSFYDFCKDYYGAGKKVEILSVEILLNENKCERLIKVKLKSYGWLKRLISKH